MNAQEMFDTVARHLLTQNARATSATGKCLYRDEEGRKCAVGCLIPDAIYEPEMENKIAPLLLKTFPNLETYIPHLDLAITLQNVHDNYAPKRWHEELEFVAKEYDLDPAVLGTEHSVP